MCHFGCAWEAILPTVCVSHSWQWRIIKVDLTWNVGRSHPLPFLHPLVSERRTWQGVPSASISSGSRALSPPPQMHLGPAVVSSSSLFSASVQHQMTALISLTQGLNKTTTVQKASARWTQADKHTRSPSCNHYMPFLCLPNSLTTNLTTSLSLTLMRSGKCPFLFGICPPNLSISAAELHPAWTESYLFLFSYSLMSSSGVYFRENSSFRKW